MKFRINTNISVVIPTLGDKHLIDTVYHLNKSSVIPKEILICIPKENEVTQKLKLQKNISVIETIKNGQVFQRYVGFIKTRYDYVLQLDDDEILDIKCIENLLKTFDEVNTELISVAPIILDCETKSSVYPLPKDTFLNSILYFVLNGSAGYIGGVVTKAGTGIGVNTDRSNSKKIKNVEWLPGGCILHKKNNLILDNYFPFKGKAYNEDLIHSYLLKKNGNKLYINSEAKAYILNENPMENISNKHYFSNLKKDFKSRDFYLSLIGKNIKIRMYIYYILIIIKFISLKIYRNL